MFLSRIRLDAGKRNTQAALSSLSKFHGAIEEAFDHQLGERDRKLWRLDKLGDNIYLMLLSREVPRFEGFVRQFGGSLADCITKDYDILLRRIEEDSWWQFRLVANPTICKFSNKGERGKRMAVVSTKLQKEWLLKQAGKNGFWLDESMVEIVESKWIVFNKKGEHTVRALSVTYEGRLQVKDVERFRNALTQGIGREKAYGMGMITIMK